VEERGGGKKCLRGLGKGVLVRWARTKKKTVKKDTGGGGGLRETEGNGKEGWGTF